jgi:hypothetical protein
MDVAYCSVSQEETNMILNLALPLASQGCGWTDIACHGDTLAWHFLWMLGLFFWMLNRQLLVLARSIESITNWLTVGEESVLASIFGVFTEGLWTPLWLIVGVAFLVFGICYALQAIIEQNWVNAQRAVRNFLMACLVLTLGSTLLGEAEKLRATTGKLLSDITREGLAPSIPIQFMVAKDGVNMPSGSIYDPDGQTCPNMNILRETYLVYLSDYAANFLLANGRDIHCPPDESSFPFRSGSTVSFQEVFIPIDISYGEDDQDTRANARQLLTMGLIRLIQGLILSLAAAIEQALYAILALSLAMTWFSLALGLVMGMFSATEGLVTASTQAIVTILKVSWISSIVMGIVAALMQQAVASGSGLAVVGMGGIGLILAAVQLWSGISAGQVALSATSTVLGGGPQMLMGALGAAAGLGTGLAKGYGSIVKNSFKPNAPLKENDPKKTTSDTQPTQGPKGETVADMADKPVARLPPRTVEASPSWYETAYTGTTNKLPTAPAPQKPIETVPTNTPSSAPAPQKPVDATTSPTQATATAQAPSQRDIAPMPASTNTTATHASAAAPSRVPQAPSWKAEEAHETRTEQPASSAAPLEAPSQMQTPSRETQANVVAPDLLPETNTTEVRALPQAQTQPREQERPQTSHTVVSTIQEPAEVQTRPAAAPSQDASIMGNTSATVADMATPATAKTTPRVAAQPNTSHASQTVVPTTQEPVETQIHSPAATPQASITMSNTATVADMAAPPTHTTPAASTIPNQASPTVVSTTQQPAESQTRPAAASVSDVVVPSPLASSQPAQEPMNGNTPTPTSPRALQTSQEAADAPNTTQESQTVVSTNQEAAQVAPPPFISTAAHTPVPIQIEHPAAPVAEGQQPVTASSAPTHIQAVPVTPSAAVPVAPSAAVPVAPPPAAPTVPTSLPASIRSRLSREPTTAVPAVSQPLRTQAETLEALTKPPEAVEALRMRGTK